MKEDIYLELCTLFEDISENVWNNISKQHSRGNFLVEESITRNIVISDVLDYIEKNKISYIYAQKSKNENINGGDLEVYIETEERDKYVRFFLQAKIIKEGNKYPNLFHHNDNGNQWDLMKEYEKISGCIPYYLLFNGIKGYKYKGKDCKGHFNEKQLGCSILDIEDIEYCYENSITSFEKIHSQINPMGIPWRKLPCCWKKSKKANIRTYTLNEINIDKSFYPVFFNSLEESQKSRYTISPNSEMEKINNELKNKGYKPNARIILTKTEPKIKK